jgi:hypothetical protein
VTFKTDLDAARARDELRHNYTKRVEANRAREDREAVPALDKARRALEPKEQT